MPIHFNQGIGVIAGMAIPRLHFSIGFVAARVLSFQSVCVEYCPDIDVDVEYCDTQNIDVIYERAEGCR